MGAADGTKFTPLTPELHRYVVEHGARPDEALRGVEAASAAQECPAMQISPEQGAFMTLLARAIGAREAIEVGTFTGYGAICIGRGLAAGGRLISLEIDAEIAGLARANLERAGLSDRVEVRVGPAVDALRELPRRESFDLAFIDADKVGYPDYYEECLARLRPGGLLLLDNVLMGGRVLDPGDEGARAVDRLNRAIAADERVDVAMLAIADGLTVARKR